MPEPEDLVALMPLAGHLGLRLTEAGPDRVEGTLPWSRSLCTAGDTLHGGALMALADTVGAVCAYLNLPAGCVTSTAESSTRFFRPVRSGEVRATARPLHVGRTLIVVQTDLCDAAGRPVGQTTQGQTVRAAGPAA
ncbi:aromatic compound degradation protein PaaI [Streptomyces mashuensis]|uniref:Aromatic compound degradation protein PaaI n=2 Tax=Streptomyces mashuensis TaxID=33904 RepID=A0A919AWR8_9ACTN|nr:PaaI family thioesterase [Streptomyces mashuensis]GHF28683.1 aromatic compound degradation protein PaaI [Streptomyces mashuensis]